MASSIETTSTTTTLKNNGNTYATVDTNDDVTITNDLAVSGDVGIGTSSPIAKLTTDSGDIAISSTQASDNGDLGEFQFWNRTNAGSGSGTSFVNDVAAIKGQMEGTGNNSGGSLHFYTKADGETKNEVMRLEGTGSLKAQSPASTTGLQPFTIDWMNENNAGIMASIGCDRTASSAAPADLVFRTSTSVDSGAISEKMRITSAGNVGINKTAPVTKLHIEGGGTSLPATTGTTPSAGTTLRIRPGNNAILDIGGHSTSGAWLQSYDQTGMQTEYPLLLNPNGGNVGIGTAAPAYPLDVYGVVGIKSGESLSWKGDAQLSAAITGEGATPVLKFWTSVNERMRIDAGGIVSIGGTTATAKLNVIGQGGSNVQLQNNIVTGTGGMVQIGFINDNGLVGSIQTSGSATSYVTSSDYRLKENVEYDWDATTRLKQLKPARFNFLADPDNTVDGFMAHEAQEVVPEAVTGVKDEMADAVLYVKGDKLPKGKKIGDIKEKSKPVMQGIDQAKLVPLLVKTIQELEARIAKLEAKK
jgi:hypothetical protein